MTTHARKSAGSLMLYFRERRGRQRGECEIWLGVLIFLCMVAALAHVSTDAANRASCQDYGKVRIFGVIYDCTQINK